MRQTFRADYDKERHARGRVKVLGFKHRNGRADGREVTREYLHYLAHHPAPPAAWRGEIAVKFVRDEPSPQLVSQLARGSTCATTPRSAPVLRRWWKSRAFRQWPAPRCATPARTWSRRHRAPSASQIARPPNPARAGNSYAANQMLGRWPVIGITPFAWPRPDGQPIDNASWASPGGLIASMAMHQEPGRPSWWPKKALTTGGPRPGYSKRSVRFDDLVDDMSRRVLHRPATPRLVEACCQATGCRQRERITADHELVRWQMPRLLSTLLDSPAHLTR